MADHESVVVQIFGLNRADDLFPDFRAHIRAVDVADLKGIDITLLFDLRNERQNLFCVQSRFQAVIGQQGRNRPACRQQQYLLSHRSILISGEVTFQAAWYVIWP